MENCNVKLIEKKDENIRKKFNIEVEFGYVEFAQDTLNDLKKLCRDGDLRLSTLDLLKGIADIIERK